MILGSGRLAHRMALACLAAILPHLGQAQSFSPPVQLSQHGYANSPMLGIDDSGTALAVWADEGSSYSVHAPGTAWSAPQSVYIAGGSGLAMQMTPAGYATIASYQTGYGIYTIDRPPGGTWTAPVTVVSGPDVVVPSRTGAPGMIFAGNAAGAQAIVWQQDNAGSQVMAVRRPAGGAWGAPELVAVPPTGLNIALAAATIGAQGDVLVAWETSQTICGVRSCNESDFIVHAAREPAGTDGWADSGPLTPGIGPDGYVVRALIDAVGHGALLLQAGQFPSQVQVSRQRAAGGRWSALAAAFTDTSGGYPTLWGAATGGRVQASFASVDYGAPLRILLGDGNIGSGVWAAPTVLSASDASPPNEALAFGANAADGVVVSWVDSDDTVRAALRRTGTAAFAPTLTVAPGDSCLMTVLVAPCRSPGAVAINAAGQAATLFLLSNGTETTSTLFGSTTN